MRESRVVCRQGSIGPRPRRRDERRLFAEAKLFLLWPWHDDFRHSMHCAPSKLRRGSAASWPPPRSCACRPRPSASRCGGSRSTSTRALFQRLARGLVLTDQGRDYLPELSAGFDLLGESTARVRAKRADGVLTLTTLAAFANGWLLPRLHRFRERAPRIDVVLRTSRQVMDFRRDAIDLAIRFAPGAGPRTAGRAAVPRGTVPGGEPAAVSRRPHSGHAGGARRLSAAARHRRRHRAALAGLARLVRARRSRPPRPSAAGRSSAIPSC